MQPKIFELIASRIAVQAGELLLKRFGRSRIAVRKHGNDFATDADLASERFIVRELKKATPHIPILAEEGGGRATDWQKGLVWVVDPLDGTKNFQGGVPAWCVSIALMQDGEPIAGAITVPLTHECYSASRGSGTRLNGKKIQVSDNTNRLNATIMAELPRHDENQTTLMRDIRRVSTLLKSVRRVRVLGAAALELALVARGVADAYLDFSGNTKIWDVAAGIILIREAGGIIDRIRVDQTHHTVQVLASNGKIGSFVC